MQHYNIFNSNRELVSVHNIQFLRSLHIHQKYHMVNSIFLFDETDYVETNPDVALAVQTGEIEPGLDHWNKWGKQEKRALNLCDRKKHKVFHALDEQGAGLEIGPSRNPVLQKKGLQSSYCEPCGRTDFT